MEDHDATTPLRMGLIPFVNLLPISMNLQTEGLPIQIVEEIPRKINEALRTGRLDLGPASSIEYLRNPGYYHILRDMGVSSRGPVRSVAVFSHFAMDRWEGRSIECAVESETSVGLLDVLLRRFWKVNAFLVDEGDTTDAVAFLRIGDRALRELWGRRWKYVWDLGEVWYSWTKLPFVFALWLVRKEVTSVRGELVEKVRRALVHAKNAGVRDLRSCILQARKNLRCSQVKLRHYFTGLDYALGEDHLLGLERFAWELFKVGRIGAVPSFSLWP